MRIGRYASLGALIGGLILSACAPGDQRPSRADLVARSQGIWLAETDSKQIAYRGSAQYRFDCLDGTASSRATARVTNVAGTWNRPQDYRVALAPGKGNRMVATVTYIGAQHDGDAPWVTVEVRALCTGPQVSR